MKQININDELYPQILKQIENPPIKLYLLGNESILKENCFAIIGSRSCTKEGIKRAQTIASELSSVGLCITSGMAKGIDSAAHLGAINTSGKTIAVLGNGLNNIYPPENKKLFYDIIDSGGAIISEYESEELPDADKFKSRNRIVSGLSIGTLVVEAHYRSGTTITASLTQKQGRKLFSIPNNVENKYGVGTNWLIRKGAILTTCTEDILEEYDFLRNLKISKQDKIEREIPSDYKQIYNLLKEKPLHINEICKKIKINVSEISSKLMMMELEGFIKRLPGDFYVRN